MRKLSILLFFVSLVSCSDQKTLDITKEEIQDYIATCTDSSRVYEIVQGPRFSRDDETYQSNGFYFNDTLVLLVVEETSQEKIVNTNIYFKEEVPVYVEEYTSEFNELEGYVAEQRVYLNGVDVIFSEERKANDAYEIEDVEFSEVQLDYSQYDFHKGERAIAQENEFEMSFDDFLILNPESYLILENEESGYGVALFITKGDDNLDILYLESGTYRGTKVIFDYQFTIMNGIERMLYMGVEFKDEMTREDEEI